MAAGAARVKVESTRTERSMTFLFYLNGTRAGLRAETGVGGKLYHAGAVAEQDPAIWTS
jgi:hypothetical protein